MILLLEGHRPGGYHIVHLEDVHHEGYCRIPSKPGYGDLSTVWLACDVSLKDRCGTGKF